MYGRSCCRIHCQPIIKLKFIESVVPDTILYSITCLSSLLKDELERPLIEVKSSRYMPKGKVNFNSIGISRESIFGKSVLISLIANPSVMVEAATNVNAPVNPSMALIIGAIIGFTILSNNGALISIFKLSVSPLFIISYISDQLFPSPIVVLTLGIFIDNTMPSSSPIMESVSISPPRVVLILKPSISISPIFDDVFNSDFIKLVTLSPNWFVNSVTPLVENSIVWSFLQISIWSLSQIENDVEYGVSPLSAISKINFNKSDGKTGKDTCVVSLFIESNMDEGTDNLWREISIFNANSTVIPFCNSEKEYSEISKFTKPFLQLFSIDLQNTFWLISEQPALS